MVNLNVDICGISENFWEDSGDFRTSLPNGASFRIIYSGGTIKRKGVAIILSQKLMNLVNSVFLISERIIGVKIDTTPVNMFVIQCYAPTLASTDDEKIQFYETIKQNIRINKKFQENLVVMGDYNAKVGGGRIDDIVGPYGLGEINDSGNDLINFCCENDLFITNTWFRQKPSARHTWTSPDGYTKNQIDFICVSKRFRNSVTNAKARPGSDCGSDHNPVVVNLKVKLKKLVKRTQHRRWNIENTRTTEIKNDFANGIDDFFNKLNSQAAQASTHYNANQKWNILKDSIINIADKTFGKDKTKRKQKWITQEILNLMEERKKYKLRTDDEGKSKYKKLRRDVQKLCRQKREEYINRECQEAEQLEIVNSAKFHKKIKELTNTKRNLTYSLFDTGGNEIFDSTLILKRWKEYCEELYKGDRPRIPVIEVAESEIPQFSCDDILKVLKKLSNGKACGEDNVPAEFIKLLPKEALLLLTNIINDIYKSGIIPQDFLQSVFITLPKVNKAKHCSDFRTISLISHASKILLQLIKQRIGSIVETHLSETQMGFRQGKGCRDAISLIRILIDKHIEKDKDVFIKFIDYSKAFDNVSHIKLIEVLKAINVPNPDLRLITALYWGQEGKVQTSTGVSENFQITKGVRQGCIISPILFNAYAEQIVRKSIGNEENGIKIGNRKINNLRYADDLVLIAPSEKCLRNLMIKLHTKSKEYNMNINIKKSKVMRISKMGVKRMRKIEIDGEKYEEVSSYKYLGTEILKDARCEGEILKRIAIAKRAFWKHKEIMRRNISRNTKLRILKTYIFSILTYGCESWTLSPKLNNKIQSFENWCYRKMLNIKWQDHICNSEVLRRMNKSYFELLTIIKKRKLHYAGHILRGSSGQLLLDVVEGGVEGKTPRGRPRRKWWDDLLEWTSISSEEAFKTVAQDRMLFKTKVNTSLLNFATVDIDEATQ